MTRRTLDALPSSILTVDADGRVIYVNAPAAEMIPTITPGVELRAALEAITHIEKVDRLLIYREIATFAAVPGGPELHWMVWDDPASEGSAVLTVWETDWSEVVNERRAAFTMAASHELREPLTTLQGFAEILNLDSSNLTAEQAEAAQIIERTARHLTVLVQDVFDLSRNSFGELRLNLEETDLGAILRSVVLTTGPRIEDRGQVLDCEIEDGLPSVPADQSRAMQMITNLINNASIHNPEGTHIRVRAGVDGERIKVTVQDDGQGLQFDDPADAFRSFRRGDGAMGGDRTGSGMGLSITKRLIQLHRGDITVDSTRGEGTVFTLFFPIERERALAPAESGGM